jgi:hypothetical protein
MKINFPFSSKICLTIKTKKDMKTKEAKKEVKNSVRTFANSKTGLSYTDMCRYYGADYAVKVLNNL